MNAMDRYSHSNSHSDSAAKAHFAAEPVSAEASARAVPFGY